MTTRTWPYGTTRRAIVLKSNLRPVGIPDHVASGQLLRDELGEGHVCVGDAGDQAAIAGETGTLTFTKGGPTGGYWKFQKDNHSHQTTNQKDK